MYNAFQGTQRLCTILLSECTLLFKCVHICMISMATNEIIIKYVNVLRLVGLHLGGVCEGTDTVSNRNWEMVSRVTPKKPNKKMIWSINKHMFTQNKLKKNWMNIHIKNKQPYWKYIIQNEHCNHNYIELSFYQIVVESPAVGHYEMKCHLYLLWHNTTIILNFL